MEIKGISDKSILSYDGLKKLVANIEKKYANKQDISEEIRQLQCATTIPQLVYTTKEEIKTLLIEPYTVYFIEDDFEIQFDSDDNERYPIPLLFVFETEKDRLNQEFLLHSFYYFVKETNKIWWYGIREIKDDWFEISYHDLVSELKSQTKNSLINCDLSIERLKNAYRGKYKNQLYISRETKEMFVDLMTGYNMRRPETYYEPYNRDCISLVFAKPYEIYETENERLSKDTNNITDIIYSYVVESNKLYHFIPSVNDWVTVEQSVIIYYATKTFVNLVNGSGYNFGFTILPKG